MNSSISQEEIEALFGGGAQASAQTVAVLTEQEVDALGEIGNICMGTAATTLSELLGRRVLITSPRVRMINLKDLAAQYQSPFVVVEVSYTVGLEGNNVLILREDDVRMITDLMMGGEGTVSTEALSELHMSAISEAMNQMMGTSATSMYDMLGKMIEISPPRSSEARIGDDKVASIFSDSGDIVQVSFTLEIEGLAQSELMQLMPIHFGKDLVAALFANASGTPVPEPKASQIEPPRQAPRQAPVAEQPVYQPQPQPRPQSYAAAQPKPAPMVDAKPIKFMSFDDELPELEPRDDGLNLIIDVPMQVTIELGKCKKTVKEILEFNNGTILVLEKLAGEPVEIVVNDKLIARGEVIQIDDNYGVRITEILNKNKHN